MRLQYLRNCWIEISIHHPITGNLIAQNTSSWCPKYAAENKYMLLDVPFLYEAAKIHTRRYFPTLKKPKIRVSFINKSTLSRSPEPIHQGLHQ